MGRPSHVTASHDPGPSLAYISRRLPLQSDPSRNRAGRRVGTSYIFGIHGRASNNLLSEIYLSKKKKPSNYSENSLNMPSK